MSCLNLPGMSARVESSAFQPLAFVNSVQLMTVASLRSAAPSWRQSTCMGNPSFAGQCSCSGSLASVQFLVRDEWAQRMQC